MRFFKEHPDDMQSNVNALMTKVGPGYISLSQLDTNASDPEKTAELIVNTLATVGINVTVSYWPDNGIEN